VGSFPRRGTACRTEDGDARRVTVSADSYIALHRGCQQNV